MTHQRLSVYYADSITAFKNNLLRTKKAGVTAPLPFYYHEWLASLVLDSANNHQLDFHEFINPVFRALAAKA